MEEKKATVMIVVIIMIMVIVRVMSSYVWMNAREQCQHNYQREYYSFHGLSSLS